MSWERKVVAKNSSDLQKKRNFAGGNQAIWECLVR